jgi:hypothetical protein
MKTLVALTLAAVVLLIVPTAQAQTWLTDPAYGARRNAYGPGTHMDATGRPYTDNPSNARVFEPLRPNAYGLGVDSDSLGRAVTPSWDVPGTETEGDE